MLQVGRTEGRTYQVQAKSIRPLKRLRRRELRKRKSCLFGPQRAERAPQMSENRIVTSDTHELLKKAVKRLIVYRKW